MRVILLMNILYFNKEYLQIKLKKNILQHNHDKYITNNNMLPVYPFIENCGIDFKDSWDKNFDSSFITAPIADLGNILDTLGDEDGVETISNIIVTTCKDNYNLSSLSANDVVYNYLTNRNNISKIIYDKLIAQMNNNEVDITNYVYDDLKGR